MKHLALLILFAVIASAATVTVSDTLVLPDGTNPSGRLFIGNPTFTTAGGTRIAASVRVYTITAGVINLTLESTTDATPAGISYNAVYQLDTGRNYSETWVIPTTGPVTIAEIVTDPAPSPTVIINPSVLTQAGAATNECLVWNGSEWAPGSCSVGGSGITSLGGQTGTTQTFANDTNVTISSATDTHTLGWTGTLGLARGGTNADLSATGGAGQVLRQSTVGGNVSVSALADADIPNTITLDNLTQVTTRDYSDLQNIPASFTPSAHASTHQHGGADEVATATAAANAIPKAGAGGTLADGWIAQSNVTQHQAALSIAGSQLSDQNAGTDITADLEEEGAINATAVTGNAADDQVLLGSGASALAYATVPDCNTENMLTYTAATNTFGCESDSTSAGGGYDTIQDEGTGLTQRTTLNFAGAGVSCADDTTRTTCTIAGGGSGFTLREADGTPSIAGVTTLEFLQSDGFVVTDQTGGVGRVALVDAPDSAVSDGITLTNITQITNRAITDTTGDLPLGTRTSGNYVLDVADGTGIDGTAAGEGATYTPTLDLTEINSVTFGDNSIATVVHTVDPTGTTNPAWSYSDGVANLSAGNLQEGGSDVIKVADQNAGTDVTVDLEEEGQINATVVTGNAADDQVILGSGVSTAAYASIPDCNTENMLTYTASTNTFGCESDTAGAGSGDAIEIEDGDDAGTFTAIDTTARFDDSGDINFTFADGGAGGPDVVTATVRADSVALTTDTTGNYVEDVAAGTGVAVTGAAGEGATKTAAFDFTDAGADPALNAEECRFSNEGASDGGWVCEGATANTIETRFRVTDPTTSDKVITFPDATGEVSLLGQTIEDGELASNYSGVGACGANTFASTLNDNAAPTCTQPSFANLSGQLADTQIADGAVDGGTGGEIQDGTVAPVDMTNAARSVEKSINIFDPTTSDTNKIQWDYAADVTITEVHCSTDVGTATIQLDERVKTTPNTAGTNVMTSSLVCDTDDQSTASFTNAGIAADAPVNLQITATASAPAIVRIHVQATRD